MKALKGHRWMPSVQEGQNLAGQVIGGVVPKNGHGLQQEVGACASTLLLDALSSEKRNKLLLT